MNSALIHKCKPSQAELLLEDSQEKKLVSQLEKPGDALLVTDYAGTKPVSMPFCTRRDMETVANMLGNGHAAEEILPFPPNVATPPETQKPSEATPLSTHPLTPELLRQHLKPEGEWGQRELERQTGVNQSKISKYKNHVTTGKDGKEALTDEEKDLIYDVIMGNDSPSPIVPSHPQTHLTGVL